MQCGVNAVGFAMVYKGPRKRERETATERERENGRGHERGTQIDKVAHLPACRASIKASSSTMAPRAVLMRYAEGFIRDNARASIKWRVCTHNTIKSLKGVNGSDRGV